MADFDEAGTPGPQGAQGAQGSAGSQGAQGPQGAQGGGGALTPVGVTQAMDVTLLAGGVTIVETADLAVGTYLVSAGTNITGPSTGGATLLITNNTATVSTIDGHQAGQFGPSGSGGGPDFDVICALGPCVVVVTAPGTLILEGAGIIGTEVAQAATAEFSVPGCGGITVLGPF